MLKLCHSAFARVTTFKSESEFFIVSLATAHSRGLRRGRQNCNSGLCQPCHSAFARVTTQPFMFGHPYTKTLPQRIRAGYDPREGRCMTATVSLPQRIRAGYDTVPCLCRWSESALPQRIRAGYDGSRGGSGVQGRPCHSAFARVTTIGSRAKTTNHVLATAHSRGLRLRKSNAAHCEFAARR